MAEELAIYNLLADLAKTYGYQLPDRKALSRRGLVVYRQEERLKQGGLTLANDLIADIARHAVRTGQIENKEDAAKFLEVAKSLEAAIPTLKLRREVGKALRGIESGSDAPIRGARLTTEGKYKNPFEDVEKVRRRFAENIRSASGRRLAVQTPDGKLTPLQLTAADMREIGDIVRNHPKLSGYYQSGRTKPSGEPFDPLVNLEVFGKSQRQMVLRNVLKRLQASGLYPKGSKVVELDEAKSGATVPLERTRDPKFVAPATTTGGAKKQRERFGEVLKGGYEQSIENRDEFGQIRQGTPTIGRTPKLRMPERPTQYDLPNEVDLVMEEGRMLFSYPGAAKPGTLEEVVRYYKSRATANSGDPDAASDYTKMLKTRRSLQYISNDPNAVNVALDRAARPAQRESQRISKFNEEAQSSRRAFKAALQEELAPRDRGGARRRRAAEDADLARAGKPGRGERLFTAKQWKKLKGQEESLRAFLTEQGVAAADIEARIDALTKPLETAGRGIVAKDQPAVPGVSDPETRFAIEDFPLKGTKARVVGGPTSGNLGGQVVGPRSVVSQVIKALQDAEVAARLDAGQTQEQILEKGGPTTFKRQGARPFDASKTKSLIPSPFARKEEEQGVLSAAEKELGTKTRLQVEDVVKRIIDMSKYKPQEERRAVIEANLLREMDKAQERGIEPSTFMKAARAAHPLVDDIMTEQVAKAAQERQAKMSAETINRIEQGDVPETAPRMSPAEKIKANISAARAAQNRRASGLQVLAELMPQIEARAAALKTGRPDTSRLGVEVPVVPESGVIYTPATQAKIKEALQAKSKSERRAILEKMARVARARRELEDPYSPARTAQIRERIGPQLRKVFAQYLERMGITSEVPPYKIAQRLAPKEGAPAPYVGGLPPAEPGAYVPPGILQRPSVLTPAQKQELRAVAARLSAARGAKAGRRVLAKYGLK